MRASLRASDVPTRYGGDEFAVILPATTEDGARTVGERILHALVENAYQAPDHRPVPITASIGTAAFPRQGRTPRELIAAADRALYRVKADGGAAVHDGTAMPDDGAAVAEAMVHGAAQRPAVDLAPVDRAAARRPKAARGSGGHTTADDAAQLADAI